jgi:long-chain acyl-CoA synthetase
MNLASIVLRSAHTHADRAALRHGDEVMPYRQLDRDGAGVAGLLRERGVRPGDRVGIMLPNTPEFAVIYYGVLRAGGIVIPMNQLLKARELTHANLAANTEIMGADLLALTPDDVIFGGLPLFHAFGQTCTLNTAVAAGACLTLLPRFYPGEALRILDEHRVTIFAGVPTMYTALLHLPDRDQYAVPRLRLSFSGGAALPVEVLKGFETAFGCAVLEGYGLSETSPVASFNHPDRQRKPGSIGTPISGVEMKVVDADGAEAPPGEPGEIVIRGHNVMRGYWRRPEATAAAIQGGWFHTGDIGRVDEDGYFFIVGRQKDLIIRGGYNVYPREIEEVMHEHPAVAEVAVIGLPDPGLGEEVARRSS